MATAPTMDEWVEKIGNKVMNEFTYNGKPLKEWIELMASGTEWIPVKYRDMSQEEIERYSKYTEATKMFDCKMPEHQESILITIEYEYRGEKRRYVDADVCELDDEYGYSLEKHDWEDVVAWMPMIDAYWEDKKAGDTE